MADGQDAELKNREFLLKVVQAWADLRNKIATGVILINGGVLVTVVTGIKDKGESAPYLFALGSATLGMFAGIAALGLVWMLSEKLFERMIQQESDLQANVLAHWFPSLAFLICIATSVVCFGGSLAYFSGWSRAMLDVQENPCLIGKGDGCK